MSLSEIDLEAPHLGGSLSGDGDAPALCRLLPSTEFNPVTNLGFVTQASDDDSLGVEDSDDAHAEKPSRGRERPVALHRVREVRREQGVAIKRASQLLGRSVDELRAEEDPSSDLSLSQLYEWQKLLEVPVADLLEEPHAPLSAPVLQRARMVRLMKTVQAIMERSSQASVRRLTQTMINQLVEIMPELEGVTPWHSVERRRTRNQNARILESNYLRDPSDEDGCR